MTSVLTNAYSRLFSLEVDGETRLAIYHMLPSEASTSEHFYGAVVVSDLDGKVFRGFKVEANEFISMYDFESLKHAYYVIDFLENEKNSDDEDCENGCTFRCDLCDLDEVIIIKPPDVPIIYPGGGGGSPPSGDPLPNLPGGGGGGANDGSCPPGEIKDELGNCVEPPEDDGVFIIGECPEDNDDGLSMAGVCLELKCPDGYTRDSSGECVEMPCINITEGLGDPLQNMEILGTLNNGIPGGQFGTGRGSFHDGTDLAAPYGTPVFAAHGGVVASAPYQDNWQPGEGSNDAGNRVYINTSNYNGGSGTLQFGYWHLGNNKVLVNPGDVVERGQIIGYTGNTGNVGDPQSAGPHLHIRARFNGQRVDPENYFAAQFDSQGINNNNCN
ncbi:M23 family metallopeptidase [Psychroflexus montanilacus]|uniref:M23 family metallopeptidase n=1 Tax=Psychroflexus montanilacus TaxID=2873598 RepID=UPI001CCEF735|nr:M23 family metallopeptidase [Psychroflexus montanilacus]MBZ9652193.1 M23 family metallopeptidase [Psychroflexus montanilacus]